MLEGTNRYPTSVVDETVIVIDSISYNLNVYQSPTFLDHNSILLATNVHFEMITTLGQIEAPRLMLVTSLKLGLQLSSLMWSGSWRADSTGTSPSQQKVLIYLTATGNSAAGETTKLNAHVLARNFRHMLQADLRREEIWRPGGVVEALL